MSRPLLERRLRVPVCFFSGDILSWLVTLAKYYEQAHLQSLHFCILLALIFVATFEVRSAILLGIHGTSAFLFLIYVPPSAWLTWREERNGVGYGAKVKKKDVKNRMGEGDRDETGLDMDHWAGRERRGWTWDCAGLEVAYLGVQCGSTLGELKFCVIKSTF
jgi:hypothetical protein